MLCKNGSNISFFVNIFIESEGEQLLWFFEGDKHIGTFKADFLSFITNDDSFDAGPESNEKNTVHFEWYQKYTNNWLKVLRHEF